MEKWIQTHKALAIGIGLLGAMLIGGYIMSRSNTGSANLLTAGAASPTSTAQHPLPHKQKHHQKKQRGG